MALRPLRQTTVASIGEHAGLVDQVYGGTELGCIVRGLISADVAAAAVARLADAPRESVGEPNAHVHGCMLVPTLTRPRGPELGHYLDAAASWHAPSIFDRDVMATIHGAISSIANARPVVVPSAADGRSYAAATVRVFGDGARVPIHCDTYQALPCLQHLATLTDPNRQLSWYLPLSLPAVGGQLAIYEAKHGDEAPAFDAPELYTIAVGDLVLFDAGTHYHAITRIEGQPRRTFAGFARLSTDNDRVYAWG